MRADDEIITPRDTTRDNHLLLVKLGFTSKEVASWSGRETAVNGNANVEISVSLSFSTKPRHLVNVDNALVTPFTALLRSFHDDTAFGMNPNLSCSCDDAPHPHRYRVVAVPQGQRETLVFGNHIRTNVAA